MDIDYKLLNIGTFNEIQRLESLAGAITSFIAKRARDPSAEKLLKYLTSSHVNQGTDNSFVLNYLFYLLFLCR